MNKKIKILLLTALTVTLSSCDKLEESKFDDSDFNKTIAEYEENKTYNADFDEISFEFTNISDAQIDYGYECYLEVSDNGTWKTVPPKSNGYLALGIMCQPGDSMYCDISSDDYDYDFCEGDYRYILPVDYKETSTNIVFYFKLK